MKDKIKAIKEIGKEHRRIINAISRDEGYSYRERRENIEMEEEHFADQILALLPQVDEKGLLTKQAIWDLFPNGETVDMDAAMKIAKAQLQADEVRHKKEISNLMRWSEDQIDLQHSLIDDINSLKEQHRKEKAEIFEEIERHAADRAWGLKVTNAEYEALKKKVTGEPRGT